MKQNALLISFISTITLSACSTLHTGPLLLGDIPLPFGRMQEGEIYKDSKNRFQVTCPISESAINKGPHGISFIYMDGISTYGIFAYEPEGLSEYKFTLENALQGIKNMLQAQEIEITIIIEVSDEYRGYQAINFDFTIPEKGNRAGRYYVSRLIKTENYIYWINHSSAIFSNDIQRIKTKSFQEAERFFNSITFEE